MYLRIVLGILQFKLLGLDNIVKNKIFSLVISSISIIEKDKRTIKLIT